MHAAVEEVDLDPCEVFVELGTLIVEGRVPGLTERGFGEGPHCPIPHGQTRHQCDPSKTECQKYEQIEKHMLLLWKNGIPMCIEVLLYPDCCTPSQNVESVPEMPYILLEQWTIHMLPRRVPDATISPRALIQAVRSFLHFSQLCAWLTLTGGKSPQNVHYRVCVPGEAFSSKFSTRPDCHLFPIANVGRNAAMKVLMKCHPRCGDIPAVVCPKHSEANLPLKVLKCRTDEHLYDGLVPSPSSSPGDTMLGESLLDPPNSLCMFPKRYQSPSRCGSPSLEVPEHLMFGKTRRSRPQRRPVVERFLKKTQDDSLSCYCDDLEPLPKEEMEEVLERLRERQARFKGDDTLSAYVKEMRVEEKQMPRFKKNHKTENTRNPNVLQTSGYSEQVKNETNLMQEVPPDWSAVNIKKCGHFLSRRDDILTDEREILQEQSTIIPSAEEKALFRRSLDSATDLVFHQKSGLPLTSSPAPIRKSGTCFDFDCSLTTVSAIKRALFEKELEKKEEVSLSTSAPSSGSSLLGTFEESVLNGRLEPVSTVEGFTAEIGASGSFCPRHVTLPVTVFFYTLQDMDKVTSPYMGHINLRNKDYHIPKKGTVQVTLFNPHKTVVKMFVVHYDLSDMPVNCQTFLRQRTLYMPSHASHDETDAQKWLRYLIHLRFVSSKSGRIYLHTDIRVIIFRKSDLDAATVHGQRPYELRSFTHGPLNPKFSPHKP